MRRQTFVSLFPSSPPSISLDLPLPAALNVRYCAIHPSGCSVSLGRVIGVRSFPTFIEEKWRETKCQLMDSWLDLLFSSGIHEARRATAAVVFEIRHERAGRRGGGRS